MLNVEELFDLEEELKEELVQHLTEILVKLNRTGRLHDLLDLLEMESLLNPNIGYQPYKAGKIIVIGQSDVKEEALLSIAASLGINKNRFEFYLEYMDAVKFNFHKMQWQPSYSVILVGPMPHSGVSKGNFGSIISALENEEGYPPVVRLGCSGLKITKSDFRTKLQDLIDSRQITCN